jgi:hypothetical protein
MNALRRLARPAAPFAFRRSIATSKPAFGSHSKDGHQDHHDHHDHRVFDPNGFDMTMPSAYRVSWSGFSHHCVVLRRLAASHLLHWFIIWFFALLRWRRVMFVSGIVHPDGCGGSQPHLLQQEEVLRLVSHTEGAHTFEFMRRSNGCGEAEDCATCSKCLVTSMWQTPQNELLCVFVWDGIVGSASSIAPDVAF